MPHFISISIWCMDQNPLKGPVIPKEGRALGQECRYFEHQVGLGNSQDSVVPAAASGQAYLYGL